MIAPAAQAAQADVDAPVYCPATHAVHALAPVEDRVSVIEPKLHMAQLLVEPAVLYWPTEQSAQAVVET